MADMITIDVPRGLAWIDRWVAHGGDLGRHDGEGNLLLEGETIFTDDDVAADLIAEIKGDQVLADTVAWLVIQMIKHGALDD